MYDPEAVYQDADLLQAQYEQESADAAADRKRGICNHGWRLGRKHTYDWDGVATLRVDGSFPQRPTNETEIPEGYDLCLDCGLHVPAR